MRLARRSNDSSVEALFRDHYASLVRALSVIHGPQAASDGVQDAFVALMNHWGRVSKYDDPIAWVRRVAINRVLNMRRAAGRTLGLGVLSVTHEDTTSLRVDVLGALEQLSDRQRAVVGLYYFADLAVADIAAELDISEGTVKATLHQARAKLAHTLKETHR